MGEQRNVFLNSIRQEDQQLSRKTGRGYECELTDKEIQMVTTNCVKRFNDTQSGKIGTLIHYWCECVQSFRKKIC